MEAELPLSPPPSPRAFQDAYLANLPTPDPIGARALEFRFVHRFKAAATDAGSKGLYGLDSGAWVSLELAYGLTDAVWTSACGGRTGRPTTRATPRDS